MTNPFAKYAQNPFSQFAMPKDDEFAAKIRAEGGVGSGMENFLAGMGKGFADIGRGASQLVGMGPGGEELKGLKAQDAALMKTGAGLTGNIAGNVAAAIPAMFVPGANTILGGSLIGAGLGALQPAEDAGQRLAAAGMGGAGGGVGVLAGRALPTVGKALIDPFRKKGREAIVGRTLARFGGDDLVNAARTPASTQGVHPTLAEATQNPGVAVLQRGAESSDPVISQAFARRGLENNAAMMSAIQRIGGSADEIANAERVRSTLTKPLYETAKKTIVESDDALKNILSKPSAQSAWARAEQLASESGETLVKGRDIPAHVIESKVLDSSGKPFSKDVAEQTAKYSGRGLHYLKMALDDMIDSAPQSGIGSHEASALLKTRTALSGWLEKNIPEYDAARRLYAATSRQPNEMNAANELAKKLQPALMDFSSTAPTRLRAQQYADALRNLEDKLPKMTGFPGATVESTFFPGNVQTLQGVAKDLASRANAEGLARGVGSNTAQNLASQNLMRQAFGPVGMPQAWGESVLAQSLARPYGWASKMAEPKIQGLLADALLDPALAEKLLRQYRSAGPGLLGRIYQGALPTAGGALGIARGSLPAQ